MITVKIKRKANNKLYQVLRNGLKGMLGADLQVGWFGTKDKLGFSDAAKAEANEFGQPSSSGRSRPPRPFILQGVKEVKMGKVSLKNPASFEKALNEFGKKQVERIKKNIDEVVSPALAKKTKRLRKERGNESDKPLIDTGSMKKNTSSRIVKK